MAACRSEWGLMWPRDAGGLGDATNHAVGVTAVDRLPGDGSQDQGPVDALAAAGFQDT